MHFPDCDTIKTDSQDVSVRHHCITTLKVNFNLMRSINSRFAYLLTYLHGKPYCIYLGEQIANGNQTDYRESKERFKRYDAAVTFWPTHIACDIFKFFFSYV